jgi:non-haem dioxygenase in morphine synthesis N-terminal
VEQRANQVSIIALNKASFKSLSAILDTQKEFKEKVVHCCKVTRYLVINTCQHINRLTSNGSYTPTNIHHLVTHTNFTIMAVSDDSPSFTIPTVDISPYLEDPSSAASAAVVTQIREACISSGFFQIINHGIASSLQQKVLQGAKLFFELPVEEKTKLEGSDARGYEVIGKQALEVGKQDMKEV